MEKRESTKVRIITDLRIQKKYCQTAHHKPETWKTVLKLLQDPLLTWATKLDSQNWYHNLGVHNKTARWMRIQHCNVCYQIQAMPFVLNLSRLWSNLMSQPIKAKLHQLGIQLACFLDDTLILVTSAEDVLYKTAQTINLLTSLGLNLSINKCRLTPTQDVEYLGPRINLATNAICPTQEKKQATQRAVISSFERTQYYAPVRGQSGGDAIGTDQMQPLPAWVSQQIMCYAAQMASFPCSKAPNVYQAWSAPQVKSP